MNPIIYDGSTTEYTGNGLGRLSDCLSCLVTEERNGMYECEITYPVTGENYSLITEGRIILVSHDERKDRQPFEIYRITKEISGVVTVNCRHISYKLNNILVTPFSASTVISALSGINARAIPQNPFRYWSDKYNTTGTFDVKVPSSVRSLLGGTEGSLLDAFGGGEYEFDNYLVKLYAHRGTDSGVTIRYGKNLTDLEHESDSSGLYNAVIPYWTDGDSVVYSSIVVGDGGIIHDEMWTDENGLVIQDETGQEISFGAAVRQLAPMDLSGEFDEAPTIVQLQNRANTILNSNEPWIPKVNINVDFVALWQTEEYKNIAPLERVRLCDTVTVQYPLLGVNAKAKVIKVVWDALTERYDRMELGEAKTSFAEVLMADTTELIKDLPNKSYMQSAIDYATEMITGGMGGNIVFTMNANGQPIEQLIMDTTDKTTAVNVWRWNLGGLGHSHSGYDGPFDDVAITQDGRINASMITVGQLNAGIIQTGTLSVDRIGSNSVTIDKLTGQITNGNWNIDLTTGTLTIGNISANNITTGTLSADRIAVNSIGVGKLAGSIANGNWNINFTDGTFTIGNISANNVTTGTMSAARIHGGTLALGGANNGNGSLTVYDSSNNVIGQWTNAGIQINQGSFRTYDGTRTTAVEAGYSKYYRGTPTSGTYIGNIGADDHIQSSWGLSMTVMYEGDGIGWYGSTNASDTSFEPILMYYKGTWFDSSRHGVEDGISINRDVLIASGYSLYHSDLDECTLHDGTVSNATITGSRIYDPVWNMNGTNQSGITRTTQNFVLPMGFTSSGTATGWWDAQLTFVHGILVDATLP